jgi:hypothetical protein
MKKILVGTTLAVFAFVPALASADCGGEHDKASMASSQPAQKHELAQAPAASNTKATAAKKVKQAADKPAASKSGATTVVAKNN